MDMGGETLYQRDDQRIRRICILYIVQAAEQEIPRTKILPPDKKGERKKSSSKIRIQLAKILEFFRRSEEPS